MRTNEPEWENKPCSPVGEKVTKPTTPTPASKPKGDGLSGIVTGEDGRMRTTNHKPRP